MLHPFRVVVLSFLWSTCLLLLSVSAPASGLESVRERGVLRHLGVEEYANFVTSGREGLSIELIRQFASWLGVEYQFVPTQWSRAVEDLLGRQVLEKNGTLRLGEKRPISGDVLCSGVTALEWRKQLVAFSNPTFLTQVLVVVRGDTPVQPIQPTGAAQGDIARTKGKLHDLELIGLPDTCLDPELYGVKSARPPLKVRDLRPAQLVPRLLDGQVEAVLLDVPSVLMALSHWPGQLKVLGPVSSLQYMACAFRPHDIQLRQAFNRFMEKIRWDGTYYRMVEKYYPSIFSYFPHFFANISPEKLSNDSFKMLSFPGSRE
ncbi:substrate-binding periplasmic protein [Desulfohalobium retbaense]|uniref:Extracellular solute-binding protein family 3 n=1 Tax=Desulfohalobium retbaense (strain ATCC 49708 / DSM 5692 / JCM 16813 / HR100) TaxID=485915 RepID=C8X0W9_DESRD|nr:transporter substrate-binding domain-containing protein [Desulfohalobium retbaense]ACV68066.1 extracellular solute-binding protein family 3 [Desulfohalobium retbaense DSM 5692]